MRQNTWMWSASALVAFAVVLHELSPSASAQEPAAAAPPRQVAAPSDETLKDVHVMRRVLVREALGTRDQASRGLSIHQRVAEVGYYGTGPAFMVGEVYVLPGQGPVFLLRTSDPVATRGGGAKAEEKPKPTVWDEELDALEGKPPAFTAPEPAETYDASKVDAMRDRILQQLALFGHRIRGLGGSEAITVIVAGGGTGGPMQYVLRSPANAGSGGKGGAGGSLWVDARSGDDRTVLTIRVSVADCQAAGANSISLDEFRRRAQVSQY